MKLSSALFLLAAAAVAAEKNESITTLEIDNSGLTDGLMMELYTEPTENECTSSLGVSMALGLVYPAAISDSEEQMRTVLGYPDNSQSILVWEDYTHRLTDRYQGRCFNYNTFAGECQGQEPTLEIANSVFVDDNVTLNATYQAVVGDMLQQLDFASDESGGMVNQWVNESTNGLIDSIVEDGKLEPWVLLAINSIYLKASWDEQFSTSFTNEDMFYSTPDDTNNAHFMHQVEHFPYSHDALPGFQVVQLGFAGNYMNESNALSMIFVLPLKGSTNTTLASSGDVLEAIGQSSLERTRVALALPKFQFESKYEDDLKDALAQMGMPAPFDNQRPDNLCIVQDRCDAFIDKIIQKTYIDVNEEGVEAAAVTAVGVMLTSAGPVLADPIEFMADRPFQFFLYDSIENLVVFEGQVGEPGITEGSEAKMEAKHGDDFWQSNMGVNVVMPPEYIMEDEMEDVPAEPEVDPAEPEPETETGDAPTETDPEVEPTETETSRVGDTETKPAPLQSASNMAAISRAVSVVAGFVLALTAL